MKASRHLEPLLEEEQANLPRLGAYAPPGGTAFSENISQLSQPLLVGITGGTTRSATAASVAAASATQETYDLPLTVADGSAHAPPFTRVNEDEDEDLPPLPPLISYCSYVRFGCAFGKWPLLVAILNLIAYSRFREKLYFIYYDELFVPFDSWSGALLAGVLLGTAAWAYRCARVIDRDVQDYDRLAQYELGQQCDDPEIAAQSTFLPKDEHVYGRVSRNIDEAFSRATMPRRPPNMYSEPTQSPESTSSLVNLSFTLWSISFAAGAFLLTGFLLTGILMGKGYVDQCDSTNPSNSTRIYKNDYSNLQSYPSGVQEWATTEIDPYNRVNASRGRGMRYNFPTSNSTVPGMFAELEDGTIFFAGRRPAIKEGRDNGYLQSDHMILVEKPGSGGGAIYHEEFWDPTMFIPVESTMAKSARGDSVASQFCFTAESSERSKDIRQSWDSFERFTPMVQTTPIFCIIRQNATSFEIRKELIAWTDKSRHFSSVRAASTGSEVLIAHVGDDVKQRYQEVVSISPASMAKRGVYHMTRLQGGYYYDSSLENTKCIHHHVRIMAAIVGFVVLVLCGAWLIFREGVPAGVAPLFFAVVLLIRMSTNQYESGITTMWLAFGTLFFHCILCCGSDCPLPAWIGRDLKVWGLYSWILSFLAIHSIHSSIFGDSHTRLLAVVLFGLSGVILNHPIPQLIGYYMISLGIFVAVQAPFFGMWYGDDFKVALVSLLLGTGVLALNHQFSSNRRYFAFVCRPLTRAGRNLLYGFGNGSEARRRSE